LADTVVAQPAVFVAHDQVLSRCEHSRELADVPWDHHRIAVRADDAESMGDIRAREPERDRLAGRDANLGRLKREHHRDHNDGRPLRRRRHPALPEPRVVPHFGRIDRLDVTGWLQRAAGDANRDGRDKRHDEKARRPHPDFFVERDIHGVTPPRRRYTKK
jgi:hypothetical protein